MATPGAQPATFDGREPASGGDGLGLSLSLDDDDSGGELQLDTSIDDVLDDDDVGAESMRTPARSTTGGSFVSTATALGGVGRVHAVRVVQGGGEHTHMQAEVADILGDEDIMSSVGSDLPVSLDGSARPGDGERDGAGSPRPPGRAAATLLMQALARQRHDGPTSAAPSLTSLASLTPSQSASQLAAGGGSTSPTSPLSPTAFAATADRDGPPSPYAATARRPMSPSPLSGRQAPVPPSTVLGRASPAPLAPARTRAVHGSVLGRGSIVSLSPSEAPSQMAAAANQRGARPTLIITNPRHSERPQLRILSAEPEPAAGGPSSAGGPKHMGGEPEFAFLRDTDSSASRRGSGDGRRRTYCWGLCTWLGCVVLIVAASVIAVAAGALAFIFVPRPVTVTYIGASPNIASSLAFQALPRNTSSLTGDPLDPVAALRNASTADFVQARINSGIRFTVESANLIPWWFESAVFTASVVYPKSKTPIASGPAFNFSGSLASLSISQGTATVDMPVSLFWLTSRPVDASDEVISALASYCAPQLFAQQPNTTSPTDNSTASPNATVTATRATATTSAPFGTSTSISSSTNSSTTSAAAPSFTSTTDTNQQQQQQQQQQQPDIKIAYTLVLTRHLWFITNTPTATSASADLACSDSVLAFLQIVRNAAIPVGSANGTNSTNGPSPSPLPSPSSTSLLSLFVEH
ncbi:hypothetical protein HK105_202933 [Polyrhizophydium stewartii]|uniref:Uncharacterized protein n=1 Tax=Polyrhizophydium stewartii TaxID=2732419 RepID=A0ABR4NDR5_9FUNG